MRYALPYDFRFNDLDAILFQFAAHVIERVFPVSADDGAAGSGKLGGRAELSGDLDHAAVLLAYGRPADLAAEIEVAVKQRGQDVVAVHGERIADLIGQ